MDFIRCDRCGTLIEAMAERDRHPTQCWMSVLACRYPGEAHPANYVRNNLCSECYAQFMAFVANKKVEQPEPTGAIEISVQTHHPNGEPVWPRDYCHYTVRQGDRFTTDLCYDEMLGTVIALLPKPPAIMAARLQTQEQYDAEELRREQRRAERIAEEVANGDR